MKSNTLPVRRSRRIAHIEAENFKKAHSYLDRFPAEIRLEIFSLLLIFPESLAFTRRGTFNPWRQQHRSVRVRLCRWNHCERHDPDVRLLLSTFSALCAVSKDIRSECRAIFFARNRWVLHGAAYSNFDAIEFICGNWGEEALAKMMDVRIELQSTLVSDDARAYRSLLKFVDAIRHAKNLRLLSVHWVASTRPLGTARKSYCQHAAPLLRNRELERNSEGGRGVCDTGSASGGPSGKLALLPGAWARREVVLQPLVELRGLQRVRIEGTVTEAWALYLENVITATEDGVKVELEAEQRAKDGLKALMEICADD